MSIQKELEDLIKNEVLVEIEDYIDELFEIVAAKKEDDEIKEELFTYEFFRNMPPLSKGLELLKYYQKNYPNVVILSAIGSSSHSDEIERAKREWLEEHGFINIKDHWNGNWNYRTYQKIQENGDLIEVDIEIDSENDFMDEYLVNCELFCKNKNGTHDSFTLK